MFRSLAVVILLLTASLSEAGIVDRLKGTINPVIDEAGILSPQTKAKLNDLLMRVRNRGVVQLQVVTLKDLEGDSIEGLAIAMVDALKLGSQEKDNGVLFLIVPSERQMRIEVGMGLEGDLPDITAKRILADRVNPLFRQGDYDQGVMAGVATILSQLGVDSSSLEIPNQAQVRPYDSKKIPIKLIEFVVLLILIIIFGRGGRGGRGRRRSGFYGGMAGMGGFGSGSGGWGSSGGGGWSGGGGGFSGGGASDRW